jgi:uncharacterized membrane protein
MRLRFAAAMERAQTSLFFTPMLFVLAGALGGFLSLRLDRAIEPGPATRLPLGLTTTVDAAREVLSTVAGATITVAGIAFSVSLLVIQLASSQYSPRVVQGLFRDPFNKRVMGIVVGTFTFCLVVLRSVRSAVEDNDAVVPNFSVAIAVVLGIVSILAIIAFINHNAHSMDVSEILHVVTTDTLEQIRKTWPQERTGDVDVGPTLEGSGHVVRFARNGWVQYMDQDALAAAAGDGYTLRFESAPGRYAIAGTPMLTIWPMPGDRHETAACAQRAVHLGKTRTLAQDPAYGVRQVVDVALKALSSGINDPTTAQDAIFHIGAMLAEFQRRESPPKVREDDRGNRLLMPELLDHADIVELAFAELRRSAAPHPTVCVYILETLALLCAALPDELRPTREPPLRQQAELLVRHCEHAGLAVDDLTIVRGAYENRFGAIET